MISIPKFFRDVFSLEPAKKQVRVDFQGIPFGADQSPANWKTGGMSFMRETVVLAKDAKIAILNGKLAPTTMPEDFTNTFRYDIGELKGAKWFGFFGQSNLLASLKDGQITWHHTTR